MRPGLRHLYARINQFCAPCPWRSRPCGRDAAKAPVNVAAQETKNPPGTSGLLPASRSGPTMSVTRGSDQGRRAERGERGVGCGRCGATLEEGDRFCGHCGAPVGGCPSCGAPVIAGHRFCRACGAALAEVTPALSAAGPAAPAAVPGPGREPTAERRVCSVLFCDVVGFTPLSEARDPEAVRELLSEYFAVARTVIGRYGGVVEKFIGDAEMAVRAALDLVIAVAELGSEAGLPGLAARAGVVTGEVAVNLAAVGEGMVAGDAVNTASRVQA